MGKQWAMGMAIGVWLAWAATAVAAEPAVGPDPPDDLQALNLTDLQWRVLAQVFHRHVFESPPPPGVDAPFVVKVEPTAVGGLYRLGPGGDLPARLTVTVGSTGLPAAIRLDYYVEDFYGRKVAAGTLPSIFPDAGGAATADLVLNEVNAFGYYHVLVTATSEGRTAKGACSLAVICPVAGGAEPNSPFGLAAPPGTVTEDLIEISKRLGIRHLALDGTGGEPLEAVSKADLVATGIVGLEPSDKEASLEAWVSSAAAEIQKESEKVPQWQIGRRPVLAGDSSAQSAAAYRAKVAGILEAVRRLKVPVSLWVAATPDVLVDVLTEGPVLAGADGVALYLDADAGAPNLRSGAYRRSLDYALQMARRMGVAHVVVAETGDDPQAASPQQQAWKLVTRHVLSLAAGAERVVAAYGRGVPTPMPAAAAYAWMTYLLDGTTYQADLWPDVPLIEAHLFVGAERRVAVVWSWVGPDPANPDRGLLVFDDGSGLEARDVVGHQVGIWKGARLIVPLGEAPIYIVSTDLRVDQVRDRFNRARVMGLAPVTVWVENLLHGTPPGRTQVSVWIQSHRPQRMDGMAGLVLPAGWKTRQAKYRFGLDPGQAREFVFDCDTSEDAGSPPYTITAAATLGEELTRQTQAVWSSQVTQRTIEVGYGLLGWEGIDPVVVRGEEPDVWAEVRTAWDSQNFYFSAVVHRERATFQAGRFDSEGDAVQLAWGLSDRADDDFGHRGRDRGFPAGAFRDTDHLMALVFGKEGAQVIRLRVPRAALRSHVPGNLDPWYGPVKGARAEISRDAAGKQTIFEAAIPFEALAPLRPGRERTFRFSFRIGNGSDAPLEWSRAAAVPDYLAGPGSFLPMSRVEGLPCQTWWSLGGKK